MKANTGAEHHARTYVKPRSTATRAPTPQPESLAFTGSAARGSNQQTLGAHQGRFVSRRSDSEEHRAASAAERFANATAAAPGRESPGTHAATGHPLTAEERAPYERFFGADLSTVAVHDDARAHRAASAVNARAFVHGGQVYLGANAPGLTTAAGRRLLAHEFSHIVDRPAPEGGAPVMRQEVEGGGDVGGMCMAGPHGTSVTAFSSRAPEPLMCVAPRPATLGSAGTLDERVAQFKQRVRTVAVQRLEGNIRSLDLWVELIDRKIPDELLNATALTQSGGLRAYIDLQDVSNPATREVLAWQAAGRYRACTGCHLLTQAHAFGASHPHVGPEWLSPNQRRAGASSPESSWLAEVTAEPMRLTDVGGPGRRTPFPFASGQAPAAGYVPPATTTAEGALMTALPDSTRILQVIEEARPIFEVLGPRGYQVLPDGMFEGITSGSMRDVRRQIHQLIRQRQADYGTLAERIRSGELGYDTFGPIVRDLLPLTDADVASAIRDEMTSHRRWEIAQAVFIGLVAIATLLVPVLAPGSALLLAAAGAADVGLAVYALATAPGIIHRGATLSLATGANNVIDPEVQQSAGSLLLMGFVGAVLAPLGIIGGVSRMTTALGRFGGAASEAAALLRVGQTLHRGEYILEMTEDGALIATSANRPDLLIIVRGDTATLYQSMGPGGMRVVASTTLSEAAGAAEAGGMTAEAAAASRGGGALPGNSGAQRLLGSGARTAEQEYQEFLEMLSGEGAAGPPTASTPVTMIPHAGARDARDLLGLSGREYQSAHGFPQSTGASWPGYNPRAALTTLQQRAVHTAMDSLWKDAFQALRRQGRTTASGQEIFNEVAESIRRAPLEAGYADTLVQRLSDEMWEFGITPTTQLDLPYPNISPAAP
jgi:hypothetical protein